MMQMMFIKPYCFNPADYKDDFSFFLLVSGIKPELRFFPKHYSPTQITALKKQFDKDFSSWWQRNAIAYSAEYYYFELKNHLSEILKLSLPQRQRIIEKIKEFNMKHERVAELEIQLLQRLSWEQLYNYFHHIQPESLFSTQLVASSLHFFDEDMMLNAFDCDLFNLNSLHRSFSSPVGLIMSNVDNPFARKIFFRKVLESKSYWLEIIADLFKSNEIYFFKTNQYSFNYFTEDISGEEIIKKFLDEMNTNPIHYRKHLPISFHDRVKICFKCNANYAKYVAEQAILYANHLALHEKIVFYPPLYEMIRQYGLSEPIDDMLSNKQKTLYLPISALKRYSDYYINPEAASLSL